jgi:hypothetical protein
VWDILKNALTGAKDLLGIEVPELPVPADLVSAAGDALTGVQEQVGAVTEAVSGTAADAVQSTAQTVTDAASDITGTTGR